MSKNPFAVFGRLLLSVWIGVIAICAVIMGGIFLSDPGAFSEPKYETNCTVVEYNGDFIDTCEFLSP